MLTHPYCRVSDLLLPLPVTCVEIHGWLMQQSKLISIGFCSGYL